MTGRIRRAIVVALLAIVTTVSLSPAPARAAVLSPGEAGARRCRRRGSSHWTPPATAG
jgi:hypothetical protein